MRYGSGRARDNLQGMMIPCSSNKNCNRFLAVTFLTATFFGTVFFGAAFIAVAFFGAAFLAVAFSEEVFSGATFFAAEPLALILSIFTIVCA